MSPTIGLPPPEPESCLVHSRVSSYKGGTLIDEDVGDLETHERRVCDPDGYRPHACPRCLHTILHVHSYRERRPRGEVGLPPVIRIVQYVCAREECGATWRVLPRFLARHLWWMWRVVEQAVQAKDARGVAGRSPVPKQTRRRWRARLAASARVLIALLAARGDVEVQQFAADVETHAARAALVEAYAERRCVVDGERLACIAALSHRLERGVRLM
jgi:hypothetical protein